MPKTTVVQNNFTGGLKTEYTGLNFPENACTSVENCVFNITGDLTRRGGINFEANNNYTATTSSGASSTYRWLNAGGDGESQILVVQTGNTINFFLSSASTTADPLSGRNLTSSAFSLQSFLVAGTSHTDPSGVECQFTDGNGYLFIFHPYCYPIYCTYVNGVVTGTQIEIQIRDFNGVPDGLQSSISVDTRPGTLSNEHNYNLQNQGWVTTTGFWSAATTSLPPMVLGSTTPGNTSNSYVTPQLNTPWSFTTDAEPSADVIVGSGVEVYGNFNFIYDLGGSNFTGNTVVQMIGTLESYSPNSGAMTLEITSFNWIGATPAVRTTLFNQGEQFAINSASWTITPNNAASNQIDTWFASFGVYPSNADIWWLYKDSTGIFNPGATASNITIPTSPAPSGHFIIPAFSQTRTAISGVPGINRIQTFKRPSTGAWFAGRIFYAGVNDSQAPVGDQLFYTWTENIYFSQIVDNISNPQFANCYQYNDPTDENFFDELASDGGVITIQGTGAIYKLFAIQNGIFVFAQNGVWFITGSTGIGFTATDYTITKISSVQSISGTSFVDVLGWPHFWNEEGIYQIVPAHNTAGFDVTNLCVGTILTFYNDIPLDSKLYARGTYNPITFVLQWIYRTQQESGLSNRYQFDGMLSVNQYISQKDRVSEPWYPYIISFTPNPASISGINYINYPNSANTPEPTIKYLTYFGGSITFSEENDFTFWLDWATLGGADYSSNFTTSFSLVGKGILKYQPIYVYMYLRNEIPTQYQIRGVWDFAANTSSGKITNNQLITSFNPNFGMVARRHKIRGHGLVLQIQVGSVSGQPFDFMGWAIPEMVDAGV